MVKNKKILAAFLSFGLILAACGQAEDTSVKKTDTSTASENTEADKEKKEDKQETETKQEVSVDETATVKQVAAYKAIMEEVGKAKEGQEVDWDLVLTTYQNELQSALTEASGEIDQGITAAIQAGKSGELDANVARQLVDKLTQSYFYQKQKSLHKDIAASLEAGKKEEAQLGFEELKHLVVNVIIPTAVKRDGYYELTGESSMEQAINAGLSAQEKALNEGNVDDFTVFKQITDKTSYRSYYLAAQSYAEKIAKAVTEGEADPVKLQIMQAEAYGFYQAIKGSLSGGNEEAANKLNEIFTLNVTDPTTIDPAEVHELFRKAFVGKILGYLGKASTSLEEGDLTKARTQALEGLVFLKDIELELVDQLGQEKATALISDAQKWFDAVSSENKEEVTSLGESIKNTLSELK